MLMFTLITFIYISLNQEKRQGKATIRAMKICTKWCFEVKWVSSIEKVTSVCPFGRLKDTLRVRLSLVRHARRETKMAARNPGFKKLFLLACRTAFFPRSFLSSARPARQTKRRGATRSLVEQGLVFKSRHERRVFFKVIMYQVSRLPLSPKLTVEFDGPTKPCRVTALISCVQMDQ